MKHTLEQMQGIHQEWQRSGLSRKAFCKERGISYATFNYWSKRLTEPGPGFDEIPLNSVGDVRLEIVFPSGTRMSFQREPSVEWLRKLVR